MASLSGLVGGYRDWRDLYSADTFTQSGATRETRDHQDVIGMYYALKRNADGMPDPKTGEKMGISIAYRLKAVPAYVVDPEGPLSADLLASDKRATQKYQLMRKIFYKGISTATIQPNPKGSNEGAPQLRQRADASWTTSNGERNGLGILLRRSALPRCCSRSITKRPNAHLLSGRSPRAKRPLPSE